MEIANMENNVNEEISQLNSNEMRGWVIGKMYEVESMMDSIITLYFNPENKDQFKKIVLNSSIVTMGAKPKILRNIDKFDKTIIPKIQRLSSIRNGFAHLPYVEEVKITAKGNKVHIKKGEKELEVMNSEGLIKPKTVKQLLEEFQKLHLEVMNYLNSFKH